MVAEPNRGAPKARGAAEDRELKERHEEHRDRLVSSPYHPQRLSLIKGASRLMEVLRPSHFLTSVKLLRLQRTMLGMQGVQGSFKLVFERRILTIAFICLFAMITGLNLLYPPTTSSPKPSHISIIQIHLFHR